MYARLSTLNLPPKQIHQSIYAPPQMQIHITKQTKLPSQCRSQLLSQHTLHPRLHRIQILRRRHPPPIPHTATNRQILRHHALLLHHPHARLLEAGGEGVELAIAVQLGALREPARPREDGRDRVRRRRPALLVLAVVPGHGAVCRLGFEGQPVRRGEHRGHEAEGAEALRDDVGLYVAVVVCGRSVG